MKKKSEILRLIGNNIRFIRESQGFTQESLASKAGLDRAYYGGIERGERNVSAINLVRIALALQVDVGLLFPSIVFFVEDKNE